MVKNAGWKKYTFIGLALFVVFLFAAIPAETGIKLAKSISPASFSQLRLYGASGTIWQGELDRVDMQGHSFQAVHWDLNLWALLGLRFSADIQLRYQDQPFEASISASPFGALSLNDVKGKIGAQQLVQLARIPAMRLDGDLLLNVSELALDGNQLTSAEGRIVWSGAETRFPQRVLLGDLAADLSNTDDGVLIKLGDAGGPLQIDASLLLDEENNYKLNGEMMARDGRQSPLGRSLSMLGSMDGQGKVKLNLNGNLSQFGFLIK